jgi:hypothetical protein
MLPADAGARKGPRPAPPGALNSPIRPQSANGLPATRSRTQTSTAARRRRLRAYGERSADYRCVFKADIPSTWFNERFRVGSRHSVDQYRIVVSVRKSRILLKKSLVGWREARRTVFATTSSLKYLNIVDAMSKRYHV